jgi:hypothetical protein
MTTIDFCNGGVPRSGRRRSGAFLWLLRVADKARAARAGVLGEYVYPCPIDVGMMERWGITPAQFDRAIATHGDDGAIVEWLEARATQRAAEAANAWLETTKSDNLDRQDREERGIVCTNCGVAYPPAVEQRATCPICEDERVTKPAGQTWISPDELGATHACEIRVCEAGLASITVRPSFAIGQRAMLVEQDDGVVLWDCLPMVDRSALDYVSARGGLKAIALSHPHFYGAMAGWSEAFGGTPVYVHEADREWVVNPPKTIVYWSGDVREIAPGVTLIRCGGHFDGGTVMHVGSAASGAGALLTGDTIMVNQYGSGVSFMRSYPTYVPLHAEQIRHIQAVLEPFSFGALYGAWWDRFIARNGKAVVAQTAERYLGIASASPKERTARRAR